ncbi:LysR family transcriptional regulator [Acidithiobacillus sp. AMEEHan]|uniref:LysR family transcriptional regulator n=1 Tax=Acidithiobacillus sp. AMEEHan TaxID=2994951 RepID=UPI0027E53B46|nr:LysR family transcriptional regulator [Acidithiobacillus sp. AMEEHan]
MKNITLRQLDILKTLGATGSYTKAAQQLHLTQSAVYVQVRKLEQEIGLPLTEQVGKKVFLTDAGAEVLRTSAQIEGQLNELSRSLEHLRNVDDGQIRIAVTSAANAFAVDLLARFRQLHGHIQIRLDIANRKDVLKSLERNDIDMAIMGEPPQILDLVALPFHRNDLVVISSANYPLTRYRKIPLERIAKEPFVLREPGSGTREAILRYFADHGLSIDDRVIMNNNESIKQAVKVGMGVAVVSRHSVLTKIESGYLRELNVEGFPLQRMWHLVHRKGKKLAPAPNSFKSYLLQHQYVRTTNELTQIVT